MAFRTCLSCWPNPCISDTHPSDFQTSYLEKVRPNARFFRFPLWEPVMGHLTPKKDIPDAMFASPLESEQDLLKWCSEKVHFLDQSCEETTFERSGSMYDELCRDDKLAEVLICRHREGSFNLSPGIVSQCLYVARVISLSCFLFCLRLAPFVYDNGSVFDHMSDLTNELSSLSDKWKWSGEACKDAFSQWNQGFISECADDSEMQEAMKLLYQMTCIPLESVFVNVDREMNLASIGGDEYVGALRVIKCGDELCNFLEDYRALFQLCGDIEFVYVDIFDYHRLTAQNHLVLGNHERATKLLNMVKSMLDQIERNLQEGGQLVARREVDGCKIAYLPPDPLTIFRQIWTIASLLIESTGNYNYADDMNKSRNKIVKEISDHKLEYEAYASEQNLITTRFHRQTYDIMRLIGEERYSEADEIFNQLDLKEGMLNSNLHHFLESVNELFVKHYDLSSGSALKWKSFCERQELLLDFSLAAGDRQLTAKFSEQYGITLAKRFYSKLFKRDIHNVQESSTSQLGSHDVSQGPADSEAQDAASRRKLWLKEELNLEFTTPAPELLKEVTSWLSDACTLDEHKRVDLPEMVKACRLLKHSIDIYSDLLLNWTQESSNEAEWLRLLESQKTLHVTLQSHLLLFAHLCLQTLQDSNDPSLKVFSQYKTGVVDGSGTISSIVVAFMISTLVWVERGRTRTLLYQLGPWYTMKHAGDAGKRGSLKEELIEFDKNEQAALSSILSCQLHCQGEPLFIEYKTQNLFGTRAVAFMIHKDPKIHSRMFDCKSDEVEDLVTKFYSTIPRQRKDASVVVEVHRILERLYDILIRPLSEQAIFKHLHPKATIVFVPDKILYRVPFALLRDRTTQKYLFQLHPIAIAPSLRVLQHCEQRLRTLDKFPLKPEGCILAVGNPSYETNLLPGTGKELEHLRSCFPNQVKTLEKDEATRGNFLELVEDACHSEEEYVFALIHLGVHGHWSKTSHVHKTGTLQFAKVPQHSDISTSDTRPPGPSYTSQALEQGFGSDATVSHDGSTSGELGVVIRSAGYSSSAADDMLPSEDIVKSGFQWRTRLVVLSACNSSRGQDYSDGEVNLPRALMIAGVPAAVVSQWEIGDSSSPILMKAFYENLKYGKDVASALQSAMIQLSSDQLESEHADIFGWGAFLIWGLPTVHLPQELWTENARKALVAKQQAESLRCLLDHVVDDNMRKMLVNEALKVHTFLDQYSATNAYDHCALRQEVVNDAIFAIETLLGLLMRSHPRVSPVVIALAEEVYMVIPFKQLERIELELEKRQENAKFMKVFRQHIMYTQATKGRHQRALDYAEKLLGTSQDAKERFIFRQERAVIWRLMGKHEDAHKEFNDLLLDNGETYELLIQTSYLKHLMEDKRGALVYAEKAKKLWERDLELSTTIGYGAFTLGFKALPNDYHEWLLNVDESIGAI